MTQNDDFKVWDGVYSSFAEARADNRVFEQDVWIGKIKDRARSALAASHSEAAIAPVAETRDYALPVVAALAARKGFPLRILDFGGGLATSFIPLAKMLPADQDLDFVVVENEMVCKVGRDLLAGDSRVRFCSNIPGVDERFDIVHCGSSIHYVDDWTGLLARLSALKPYYLIFNDLPAADNCSFVTAQKFYGLRMPVWFWNLDEFVGQVVSSGYRLLLKARYRGPYLGERDEPPTGHFDPQHRLRYFAQLVFAANTPS